MPRRSSSGVCQRRLDACCMGILAGGRNTRKGDDDDGLALYDTYVFAASDSFN